MLPWFFPKHIFSDGQEVFALAPQVKLLLWKWEKNTENSQVEGFLFVFSY